jgi:hypothetical protein
MSKLLLQLTTQGTGILNIPIQVEMLNFLLDDPVGHGVDVKADDVTAQPIRLYQRSAASHEGICDLNLFQII